MNELKFVCLIDDVLYLIDGAENRIDALEKLLNHLRKKRPDIFIEELEIRLVDIEVEG